MVTEPSNGAGLSRPARATESPSGSEPAVGTAIRTGVPANVRPYSGCGLGGLFCASAATMVITAVAEANPPLVSRTV